MRIGILTFHDEVNYGSLLQAYAMQTALQDMGHDAVIIDRWYEPRQYRIYGILHAQSIKNWLGWLRRVVWGSGEWALFLRQWRSRAFMRKRFRLTPYHFCDCKDSPKDLGLDLVVVGSDQVWRPSSNPRVYLLTELRQVPGIAYAASFGVPEIPEELEPLYREGMRNFKAVGVREKEGVELAKRLGAAHPVHVVDPTLLVDPRHWNAFLSGTKRSGRKRVACYFLGEDYLELAGKVGRWARERHVTVDFFVQDFHLPFSCFGPRFKPWLRYWKILLFSPLRFRYAAGPVEFVRSVAAADCVFSNSFHALMFSTIFRKNVRIVKPTHPGRKKMAARMQEFSGTIIHGPLIMETIDDAFASYERGETVSYNEALLQRRRSESMEWLAEAISNATNTDTDRTDCAAAGHHERRTTQS